MVSKMMHFLEFSMGSLRKIKGKNLLSKLLDLLLWAQRTWR
jgi:hypothetical protein